MALAKVSDTAPSVTPVDPVRGPRQTKGESVDGMIGEAAVREARKRSVLDPLDARLSELRDEFPGWQIWFVYRAKEHGGTTWCAQPKPLLNCGSPSELRRAVHQAGRQLLADLASRAARDDAAPEDGTPEDGTPPGVTELPRRRRPGGMA